jgi:Leucine-rich repeat (LRR) protein
LTKDEGVTLKKNIYLMICRKQLVLFFLFSFLFLSTAWPMLGGFEEQKEESSGQNQESLCIWKLIFSFLLPTDIAKIKVTGSVPLAVTEAAVTVCSNQSLFFIGMDIDNDLFANIKKGYCRGVQSFDLSRSKFNPQALKELPENLLELSLEGTQSFEKKHLKWYELDFDPPVLVVLSELRSLKKLNLNDIDIRNSCVSKIVKVATKLGIQDLRIRGSHMNDPEVEKIAQIQQMICLDLSENSINANAAKHISKMKNIMHLNLHKNNIGNNGAEYISQMQNLTYLNLKENDLPQENLKV